MWLLWGWMGIDHWELHGIVLWVMHWDSMDLHWGCSLGIPWKCSMAMPLGCPHGSPMDLHWQLLHRSTLEDALWVVHWEFHQVASMALAGDCSLGIPMAWLYG